MLAMPSIDWLRASLDAYDCAGSRKLPSCWASMASRFGRGWVFGTDKIAFDVVSIRFAGTPAQTRHFERFSDALKEIIDARVWGGIHFRTADEQGAKLGKAVAKWERKHYFKPLDGCQDDAQQDGDDD